MGNPCEKYDVQIWLWCGIVAQGVGNPALFIQKFKERLIDCSCQDWHASINEMSKLGTYCTFKSLLEPEKYLNCIEIWKHKVALLKLRISSHNLEIEHGRHQNVGAHVRFCKYCAT